MGGVVDGGVGIGIKTSPRRAAIEKAQAELTQEYNVREARKRELEFLEKGGNPLDFKFGNLTLSLQSTSLNDRHLDQYPSSEAKGSFALAASPLGDSFESSGRPGVPSVHGRNSADNPVHFAGENIMHEVEKNRKNDISSFEQSSQLGRNRNGKETEESTIFRPYARRNRSRSNCDGGRLSSADAVHNRGGVGSSVAARASLRDGNGSSSEANNQKDQNAHTSSKPKILRRNADMVSRTSTPENRLDGKIGGEQNLVSTTSLKRGCMPIDKFEATTKGSKDNQHKQSFGNRKSSTDAVRTAEDIVRGEEGVVSGDADDLPSISRERDDDVSGELNGSSDVKGDIKNMTVKIQNASEAVDRKALESATCPGIGLDVENDAALDSAANVSSSGITVEQLSEPERNQKLVGSETVEELNVTKLVESNIIYRKENDPAHLNHGAAAEVEEETNASCSLEAKGDSACIVNEVEQKQQKEKDAGDTIKDGRQILHNHPNLNKETSFSRPAADVSSCEAPTTSLSGMKSASLPYHQSLCDNPNSVDKAYEDSVLEEARIIEAKHKRIAEFSFRSLAVESRQRCQWDFVLEEMTWLANDFAQERLWKTTAAAQLCHRITSVSRLRLKGQSRQRKLSVAHSLSQAVMQFWRSAEALLNSDDTHSGLKDNQLESLGSQRKSNVEVSEENTGDCNMVLILFIGLNFAIAAFIDLS